MGGVRGFSGRWQAVEIVLVVVVLVLVVTVHFYYRNYLGNPPRRWAWVPGTVAAVGFAALAVTGTAAPPWVSVVFAGAAAGTALLNYRAYVEHRRSMEKTGRSSPDAGEDGGR